MKRKLVGRIVNGRAVETKDFTGINMNYVSKRVTIQSPTYFRRRAKVRARKR